MALFSVFSVWKVASNSKLTKSIRGTCSIFGSFLTKSAKISSVQVSKFAKPGTMVSAWFESAFLGLIPSNCGIFFESCRWFCIKETVLEFCSNWASSKTNQFEFCRVDSHAGRTTKLFALAVSQHTHFHVSYVPSWRHVFLCSTCPPEVEFDVQKI